MDRTIPRRHLLATIGGAGIAAPLLAAKTNLDDAQVAGCEEFAGLDFTPAERAQMLPMLDDELDRLRGQRALVLENDLAPAETFDPRLPGWRPRDLALRPRDVPAAPPLPRDPDDIAFAGIEAQSAWLMSGRLKSRELVDIYLARIAKRAGRLECVVTLVADQARAEADQRDRQRAAGKPCGPLHGLPYALKDLFDTAGIPTTWGAEPYRNRVPHDDAAAVKRLREAGAVLIAKSSCGAIAYGDIWFGGRTRNPWNIEEGSSGSSAGSAAMVADGLCSFAIGTETMGSIVAPSARCGSVGLRPTFGRVPRTGAMALAWSYDKIGVLARAPRDTERVLRVLHGEDGSDPGALSVPLGEAGVVEPSAIRLGYQQKWFDRGLDTDRLALRAARDAGFELVPVTMPELDTDLLSALVVVEAASAFEELTLDGRDDTLRWQAPEAWPNSWRAARFEPAIGHVHARRLRRRLMIEFERTMVGIDAVLHPVSAGRLLSIGNHCGYPSITLPVDLLAQPTRTGFAEHVDPILVSKGEALHHVPFGITLTGKLFEEHLLVAIADILGRRLPMLKGQGVQKYRPRSTQFS